ncbi:hypothetical protein CORC01_11554 [Colletotrichum orchidophilum]|uniref:Uncharacterized protein n=1 Tax=Colletotrichum orchidophilum TaxID=1209926 RepID=A0A1G4AVR5_9PEZI|nr:uncharacterized protein CORC01_11554 [Colletotrichum orchidophilum]OHE93142.1 hypothetical protein CORC01_11554 [Colletotrichum orchidophilum]
MQSSSAVPPSSSQLSPHGGSQPTWCATKLKMEWSMIILAAGRCNSRLLVVGLGNRIVVVSVGKDVRADGTRGPAPLNNANQTAAEGREVAADPFKGGPLFEDVEVLLPVGQPSHAGETEDAKAVFDGDDCCRLRPLDPGRWLSAGQIDGRTRVRHPREGCMRPYGNVKAVFGRCFAYQT